METGHGPKYHYLTTIYPDVGFVDFTDSFGIKKDNPVEIRSGDMVVWRNRRLAKEFVCQVLQVFCDVYEVEAPARRGRTYAPSEIYQYRFKLKDALYIFNGDSDDVRKPTRPLTPLMEASAEVVANPYVIN